MRIELYNGATYSPIKIAPKQTKENNVDLLSSRVSKAPGKLANPVLDGLNPQELNLLQKLFGEISQSSRKELSKSVQPGQFVDITL